MFPFAYPDTNPPIYGWFPLQPVLTFTPHSDDGKGPHNKPLNLWRVPHKPVLARVSEVGGKKRSGPNREIVSFRACVRRAVSGCEEESKCKNHAGRLSLFPFVARGLPFSL